MFNPMLANKNGFDAYQQVLEEIEDKRQDQITPKHPSLLKRLFSLLGQSSKVNQVEKVPGTPTEASPAA